MKNSFIISFAILIFGVSCYSQDKTFLDKFSCSMNFKLPKSIANQSFRNMIYGVGNIDMQFQYELFDGFEYGIGYKYGYYDVNSLAFQTKVDGQMENHNPFMKIGWIKRWSDRIFINVALKGGYNYSVTKINTCNQNYSQNSFRIEPEFALYMHSNEQLAFGLILSYNIWLSEFGPDNFCMTNFSGMNASSNNGIYQVFCAGFGFHTYFPKRDLYGN